MRSKGRQGKLSLTLLFVGIFAFWWGISVLAQNNNLIPAPPTHQSLPASTSYTPQNVSGPVSLQITHSSDAYTYTGLLPLSSSCDNLGTGIAVSGTNPAHVTVLITLTKPITDCAEASTGVTEAPFAVSLSVNPRAQAVFDGLTVNGIIVATNVTGTKAK